MHRFRYNDLSKASAGELVELEKAEAAHLFKTLRAAPGFEATLMDGKGLAALAKVAAERRLEIISLEKASEPSRKVHLFIAPPRRQKMDQILRQCAELGVWSIQPMICERSVSLPDEESVAGRWDDALYEACKQSGNPFIPQTNPPLPFKKALVLAAEKKLDSYFGAVRTLGAGPSQEGHGDFAWFVGPEGGFSPAEEEELASSGVKPLRIGRCVLRVETAAVCGVALLSGCQA